MTLHQRIEAALRDTDLVTVVGDMQATLRQSGNLLERPLCRISTVGMTQTDAGLKAVVQVALAWRRAGQTHSDATLENTIVGIVDTLKRVPGALPELSDVEIDYGVQAVPSDNLPGSGVYDLALIGVRDA